jgi:formylglycine-generating enzyme required for sulfatase activity
MVVKRFLVLAMLMMTLAAFPVQAAKRVALVIGNNAYATLPNLNNAKKDAEGMAAKLRGLGFDVILKTNAGRREMGRTLADFENRISNADVALVFYAGHGIQANGTNHLIPSDARIEIEEDLRYESIDAQDFLKAMKRAGTSLNIVVLDACRDNPLPRRTRSAARGLAIPAPPAGIKGTAIIYSAAPGQTAQDGPRGGHGVFTGALLAILDKPNLKLEDVFKETATRVAALTNGKQDPWINSSVKGDFYFKRTGGTAEKVASIDPRPRPATPPAASSTPRVNVDELDENKVAARNANVRSGPSSRETKLSTLRTGTSVQVTGRVQGRNWYQVVLSDGRTGYVFAPLLRNPPDTRIASTGPAVRPPVTPFPTVSDPSQVVLSDGLRLSDWVLLAKDRLKAGEYRSLLVEGMAHRRKYGQFASLNTIVDTSVTALLQSLKVNDLQSADAAYRTIQDIEGVVGKGNSAVAEAKNKMSASLLKMTNILNVNNAKKALDTIAFLKARFGDSLSATYLEAKAHHRLEQFGEAEKKYRGWLQRARPDAKERKKVLALLFRAQKHQTLKRAKVGSTFRDCPRCPEMVVIPAGNFMMGSQQTGSGAASPQHQVTIHIPFAVGKFEVTQNEWRSVMGSNPSSNYENLLHPVERVNWSDAQNFIEKLSDKTGKTYRLLSEAEWEYAARARTKTRYSWGNSLGLNNANYGNRGGKSSYTSFPVGNFGANAFGLHDMHGNVSEWVGDCWNKNYHGAPTDGSIWTDGNCSRRITRGGSWDSASLYMQSSVRLWHPMDTRNKDIGFRVARDLE